MTSTGGKKKEKWSRVRQTGKRRLSCNTKWEGLDLTGKVSVNSNTWW